GSGGWRCRTSRGTSAPVPRRGGCGEPRRAAGAAARRPNRKRRPASPAGPDARQGCDCSSVLLQQARLQSPQPLLDVEAFQPEQVVYPLLGAHAVGQRRRGMGHRIPEGERRLEALLAVRLGRWFFGLALGHLAQSDAPSLAVGGNELESAAAI